MKMLRGVILKPYKTYRKSPNYTFFMEEKEIYWWKKLKKKEKVAKITNFSCNFFYPQHFLPATISAVKVLQKIHQELPRFIKFSSDLEKFSLPVCFLSETLALYGIPLIPKKESRNIMFLRTSSDYNLIELIF